MTLKVRFRRSTLLGSTGLIVAALAASQFLTIKSAHAQALLDQNMPKVNLGPAGDYRLNGAGAGPTYDTVNAEMTAPGVTVLTRPHPEYDPLGMQISGVTVNADASDSIGYDTNPLGLSHAKGSVVNIEEANLGASKDWARGGVTAAMSVDSSQYFSLSEENHTDWTALLGGYLNVGNADRLEGTYTHANLNVLPNSIDTNTNGSNQVVQFTDDQFVVNYAHKMGNFTITPDASYSIFRFDQTDVFNDALNEDFAASVVNQKVNNRNVAEGGVTVRYEMSPGRDLVGIVRYNNADFTFDQPGIVSQNYNDIEGLFGIDFQTENVFRYRALVGYEHRSYNDSSLSNQDAPVFEGQVIWTPSEITTVTGTVSRKIEDAISAGSTSYTYTTGRLQVDHELYRNVILTGFGQAQYADYNQDNTSALYYDAGVSATWQLNRHIALVASDEFVRREGWGGLNSFNDNISLLQLKFSL